MCPGDPFLETAACPTPAAGLASRMAPEALSHADALVGRDLAYEPAALAIMSFLITWGCLALMQLASRGIGGQGSAAGGVH